MSPIAPAVVLIAGLLATAGPFRLLLHAIASTSWPTAPGKITSASASTITAPTVVRGGWWSSVSSAARVEYSYSVEGRDLTGTNLSFSGPPPERWGDPATYTATLLKRYEIGAKVSVHYNADNPVQSVLEPGANRSNYWALLPGLGILVVGVTWLIWS